jgi:hypothetical protein
MKRVLCIGLLIAVCAMPVFGAKNSLGFSLTSDVRVGDVRIPKGDCTVTWAEPSGNQVVLTIKTNDRKTFTVQARIGDGKPLNAGPVTFNVEGTTYLKAIHTKETIYLIQESPNDRK